MPDKDGLIRLPDAPGLGITVNTAALRPYLQEVEIAVAGRVLFRSSPLPV
jgi:hypothetical protein